MSAEVTRVRNFVNDKNNTIPITASYMDSELDQLITACNQKVVIKATAPGSPIAGMLWLDSTNKWLKQYRNNEWVIMSPCHVGTSAHATAQEGDLWYDTTNDVLKTYNGSVWTAVTAFATPAIVLGTAAAAGSATTTIRSDATIVAFDATTPAALGTAATGSATVAARRDHVHSEDGAWIFVESLSLSSTSHTSGTLPTTSDVFMLVFDNVSTSSGTVQMRFNGDTSAVYEYQTLDTTSITHSTAQTSFQLHDTATAGLEGTAVFNRLQTNNGHGVAFALATKNLTNGIALRGGWDSSAAITTVTILSSGNLSGKVHIFRSTRS